MAIPLQCNSPGSQFGHWLSNDAFRVTIRGENIVSNVEMGPGLCLPGVQPFPLDSDFGTLGQTFLEGVYAIFDVGNERIGFAEQA